MNRTTVSVYALSGLLVMVSLTADRALAFDVVFADVAHHDNIYEVSFRVRLEVSPEEVRRIVTDYANLPRLSPTIVSSRVTHDPEMTLTLSLRPCVWVVFCKTLRKVSTVREGREEIAYDANPQTSDFLQAAERLSITRDASNPRVAEVEYRARLEPKFSVPPLIGPWLIERQIIRDLEITSERLEIIARSEPRITK